MTGFLDEYRGEGPLRHLTILDFSQMMMGPVATQMMGDLGALVIKVERPGSGEWERDYLPRGVRLHGESPYFLAMNRNKIGITADLRDPSDVELVKQLVARCDAVVENFRPGVMDRLGLGFDDLLTENPSLVYASGSGYGASGPAVRRPGQDLLIQAASGLASNSGRADVPPTPVAAPVLDASTAFVLAFSLVSSVLDARASGRPRKVEASLLGTSLMIQCQEALVAMNTDLTWTRSSTGVAAPWADAPYGIYATSDGAIAVSMTARPMLVEQFGLPDRFTQLDDDAYFLARDEMDGLLRDRIAGDTSDAWLARLEEAGVWCAPVRDLEDVLRDEQVAANGYVRTIHSSDGHPVDVIGFPARLDGVDDVDRLSPPRIGEHDDIVRSALANERTKQ